RISPRSQQHWRPKHRTLCSLDSFLYEQETGLSRRICARKRGGSALRGGIIAIARQQCQVGPPRAHLDAVVVLRTVGLLRHIGERVLVASLFGNGRVEVFQLRAPRGVEDIAAGGMRVLLKHARAEVQLGTANPDRVRGEVRGEQKLDRVGKNVDVAAPVAADGYQEMCYGA